MEIEHNIPLKPDEDTLVVIREHLAPRMPRFVLYTLLTCLPFFFIFPLFRQGLIGVIGFFILLLVPLTLFLREYRRWADTLLIVTDRRIIDVERRGFFDREVCEAAYSEIDEVTFRVKGLVPTVFRYGMIDVKTAGNAADMEFKCIPRPADIHEIIADARRDVRDRETSLKERKLRALSKRVPIEEIEKLERKTRERDQEEALEAVYGDGEAH